MRLHRGPAGQSHEQPGSGSQLQRGEIGIEIIDNESLTAIWPTQMPFSPAPREFRSEFDSKGSGYKRGKEGS